MDQFAPDQQTLPPKQTASVEHHLDCFDKAHQAGQQPRIEDFLDQVAEADRPALLRALVLREIGQRQGRGEAVPPADYQTRFPQLEAAWLSAQLATLPPGGTTPLESDSARVAVPGYEILGELGRGGMGVVYKARHLQLDRLVALKMILAGSHAGADQRERFRREVEAVARFQHPNIVQVHEVGEHAGHAYCALEYVEGGSLDQQLAGTPRPARQAAELVEVLARAVQAAHAKGIIHRDLKPANVLLTADGTPKVTDFGLAKQLDSAAGQTQSGAIVGTPSYMAPEQAAGRGKAVGPAADVYALGAILYECLTGRPPFKAETPLDTLMQVVADEPVPPSHLQPKTPRDLETICLKCLAKEQSRRYGSALELAEDLGRYLNGEPIRARPVGTAERAAKWVKRHAVVSALAAAVLLALLAGVAGSSYFAITANEKAAAALRAEAFARDEKSRADEKSAEAERQALAARKAEQKAEAEALAARTAQKEAQDRAKAEAEAKALAQAERARAEQQLTRAEWLVYAGRLSLAQSAFQEGNGGLALQYLDECQWNLRGWEHRHLWTRFNAKQTFLGHRDIVTSVAFSPDGRRLVSGSEDQTVKVWDAERARRSSPSRDTRAG